MKLPFQFVRLSAIVLCAIGALSFSPDAEARKMRLRLTTLAPKHSCFHESLLQMGQQWKKETQGAIDLIVFSGGIQGGEAAMIDRMRINQTQSSLLTGIGLAEIDRAVAVLQKVPLLYRSLDELEYVMDKIGPALERGLQAKGFVVLSWIDTGWVRIFSKSLLETPHDMEKMKLFTWAGDWKQTDLLKKLGFRPVPIDSTEIMSSLLTGLIDTVPLPPFYALASQAYKSAPYMLDFNYAPMVGAIIITDRAWQRIPTEQQRIMRAGAKEAAREMTTSGRQQSEDSIRVMVENWDLKVRKMDEELRSDWQNISQNAHSFIRDNTVPAAIWDEVVGHLEEYRRSKQ